MIQTICYAKKFQDYVLEETRSLARQVQNEVFV